MGTALGTGDQGEAWERGKVKKAPNIKGLPEEGTSRAGSYVRSLLGKQGFALFPPYPYDPGPLLGPNAIFVMSTAWFKHALVIVPQGGGWDPILIDFHWEPVIFGHPPTLLFCILFCMVA